MIKVTIYIVNIWKLHNFTGEDIWSALPKSPKDICGKPPRRRIVAAATAAAAEQEAPSVSRPPPPFLPSFLAGSLAPPPPGRSPPPQKTVFLADSLDLFVLKERATFLPLTAVKFLSRDGNTWYWDRPHVMGWWMMQGTFAAECLVRANIFQVRGEYISSQGWIYFAECQLCAWCILLPTLTLWAASWPRYRYPALD